MAAAGCRAACSIQVLSKRICSRGYATGLSQTADIVLRIPRANIYQFGDPNTAVPVIRDLEWTVKEGENWAVVGSGSGLKTTLLQTLTGNLRISPPPPPPGGLFPFLAHGERLLDAHECVSLVSFAHRPRTAHGGGFYDYTARYGAVRDEDRTTLRQTMFPEIPDYASGNIRGVEKQHAAADHELFHDLVDKLGLEDLLDLPFVALSNGQTRRARIVKAVLSKPELLLLDEPLTGLDVGSRPKLLAALHALHVARQPRIIIGLRSQDPLPEWITHIALVKDRSVLVGERETVLATAEKTSKHSEARSTLVPKEPSLSDKDRKTVVKLANVNVLKDINWTIREGDRWHLIGPNGSGKTTLLSLLTGDHPQSYTQRPPTSELTLFDRPRSRIATAHLHARIGVVSPEVSNAFPRRGMNVWEAVATGFEGGFVLPRGEDGDHVGVGLEGPLSDQDRAWRVRRVWEMIQKLGPTAWSINSNGKQNYQSVPSAVDKAFAERAVADLSAGEQSMVLLMRALVGRPPLVLLDEVWSGMDEGMIEAARHYLRDGNGVGPEQAVVVVSHWEEEVPWTAEDGVRRYVLDDGFGSEV
ncbi:hypothetical protein PLICRDRAFT_96475 [Plicaturopsis crispa FD-325 SS-3]|nr:hypothetical protein PLICRDRAFT_96475 [Plicaturopsis crispa FD-325 SS-3]